MEKYANENTIIKNEMYDFFKDSITCQICSKLMIEPVICLGCQNTFCKKCIEEQKKKDGLCPLNCDSPNIKDVIEKNNNIFKFKFKCIKGCGEEILFKDLKAHYSSDCLSKKKKIKALEKKEVAKYKKETGKEVDHLTSK